MDQAASTTPCKLLRSCALELPNHDVASQDTFHGSSVEVGESIQTHAKSLKISKNGDALVFLLHDYI